MKKSKFNQMSFPEQAEVMQIICNLQAMSEKITGSRAEFTVYENRNIDELRLLQDLSIIEYNKTFITI